MDIIPGHPHGRHFRHCCAYEGSFCSCGGQYSGDDAGPRLELPLRAVDREWQEP
ncbi:hypothetical protein OG756_41045 [Streptomyces sp. NBC_01310]|uniref:hypothetical protein n=1 Tax=Streptomyces sp. NBC_01310 TaxID=2903820 RepID=UPI0035B5A560|nr:hypothetical protein OG756_00345 [Streptomyces sp. NBC_01310]WSJ63798.1 hypothetical protein OG756_41045 [Streptomyces sp. NBC_01310]